MSTDDHIILPSTSNAEQSDVICRLCKRQFAKYTCPKCNVPYCSLPCFRSGEHNSCSEGFYKKEIEENINAEPSKTEEERQKMIQLLQKFEEESQEQDDLLDSDDDNDATDLMSRFASIDIDSTSPEVLWSLLSPEEKDKFLKAFQNPSSDLAQTLLSSDLLEAEIQQPWWDRKDLSNDDLDDEKSTKKSRLPNFIPIPTQLIQQKHTGKPLIFNIVALCVSYAYITRHLGTSPLCYLKANDPEYHEALRLFSRMVPFLTDRKSTTLYPDLSVVITDFWASFDLGSLSNELFSLLLEDTAQIVSPLRVIEDQASNPDSMDIEYASHPHSNTLRMLSDIYHLFSLRTQDLGTSRETQKTQPKPSDHVGHKLLFYGGYVLSTPSAVLNGLVAEIRMVAHRHGADASEERTKRQHGEN